MLLCLYLAHSCTEHRPRPLPSGSEATLHENQLYPSNYGAKFSKFQLHVEKPHVCVIRHSQWSSPSPALPPPPQLTYNMRTLPLKKNHNNIHLGLVRVHTPPTPSHTPYTPSLPHTIHTLPPTHHTHSPSHTPYTPSHTPSHSPGL